MFKKITHISSFFQTSKLGNLKSFNRSRCFLSHKSQVKDITNYTDKLRILYAYFSLGHTGEV